MARVAAVGTDLSKRSPGRPNPKDLKLLREVCYENPAQKLCKLMDGDTNEHARASVANIEAPVVLHHRPLQKAKGVDTISLFLSREYKELLLADEDRRPNVVGFQLVKIRAQSSELNNNESACPRNLRPRSKNKRRRQHAVQTRIRRETLDRCGLGRLTEGKFRICTNHSFTTVSQRISYERGHG